jgi:hypothetical protein
MCHHVANKNIGQVMKSGELFPKMKFSNYLPSFSFFFFLLPVFIRTFVGKYALRLQTPKLRHATLDRRG